jgi:hypothetical protein
MKRIINCSLCPILLADAVAIQAAPVGCRNGEVQSTEDTPKLTNTITEIEYYS